MFLVVFEVHFGVVCSSSGLLGGKRSMVSEIDASPFSQRPNTAVNVVFFSCLHNFSVLLCGACTGISRFPCRRSCVPPCT